MQPLVISLVLNTSVFAVGLFLLYTGYRWYSFGSLVRDTPTANPGSVAVGRAEVSGTAQPDGDPLTVPFLDEEAVYMDWTVEEREDGEWVERAAEQRLEPFYLQGEHGRVLVRPDKHPNADDIPWEYDSKRFRESETDEVERFLAAYRRRTASGSGTRENPAVSENPAVTDKAELDRDIDPDQWRFVVRLLPPGTDLYVFGAVELQSDRGDAGLEPDTTSGRFIISRSSEEQMTEGAYWLGMVTFAAGLLFVLWGGTLVTGQFSADFAVLTATAVGRGWIPGGAR